MIQFTLINSFILIFEQLNSSTLTNTNKIENCHSYASHTNNLSKLCEFEHQLVN